MLAPLYTVYWVGYVIHTPKDWTLRVAPSLALMHVPLYGTIYLLTLPHHPLC